MNEYTGGNSINPITQPSEPRFDDERTLLTARPVVPLAKIDAKVRHRRQWALAGAFAVAMMLGAASALLASYLKLRHATPSVATDVLEEVDAAPAPVAVAEPQPSPDVQSTDATAEAAASLAEPLKKEPSVKHRTGGERHTSHPAMVREPPRLSEDEELQHIRDAVLYDQWEERRARRVLRRERRRNEHYNHRDLSNLNEIFEGRRRP
jgi:hypothetical protein